MPIATLLARLTQATVLAVLLTSPALACSRPGNLSGMQAQAIRLINDARSAQGKPKLVASEPLTTAAQSQACDMAIHDKLTHTGSDGSKLATRVRRVGYSFRTTNENIAWGQKSPAAAVQGWLNSPGHRKNIMASGTRDIGIGMAYGPGNAPYWVMISAGSR